MARGDFVEVTYRTGAGIASHKVRAHAMGARVEVLQPRGSADLYLEVREVNMSGLEVEKALFAKNEVVAVIEGHETAQTARKAQKRV